MAQDPISLERRFAHVEQTADDAHTIARTLQLEFGLLRGRLDWLMVLATISIVISAIVLILELTR